MLSTSGKSLLVLRREDNSCAFGGKAANGYAKIDYNAFSGKLAVSVQNLAPDKEYSCYMYVGGRPPQHVCRLRPDRRGAASAQGTFNFENITHCGIYAVAVVCAEANTAHIVLSGYKGAGGGWREDIIYTALNKRGKRAAEPVNADVPRNEPVIVQNNIISEDSRNENIILKEEKMPEKILETEKAETAPERPADEEIRTEAPLEKATESDMPRDDGEGLIYQDAEPGPAAHDADESPQRDNAEYDRQAEEHYTGIPQKSVIREADTDYAANAAESDAENDKEYRNGDKTGQKHDENYCYYDTVKDYFDDVFNNYIPEEDPMCDMIPNSKWCLMSYNNNESCCLIGLIYDYASDRPLYICYGVPGENNAEMPNTLNGYCQWLPGDARSNSGMGYWMMYQDARTGETIVV